MSIFPTKVLLATDGSRDAELARTTAVDLANSTNSELHVVTVAPGRPSYDVRNPEVVEHLRRQAEEILNDQAAKIEQEGGKVAEKHLRIAERYRAQQIVKVAEDIGAGLIVMGSRGLGGVRRAQRELYVCVACARPTGGSHGRTTVAFTLLMSIGIPLENTKRPLPRRSPALH